MSTELKHNQKKTMGTLSIDVQETGLEVIDLLDDSAFAARRIHSRDALAQMTGVRRLARAFVENPDNILQELVNAAIDLCGADSAAISVVKENGTDAEFYHWVASAGVYAGFLNAMLPRYPSACGICLERGRPQVIRVLPKFFELLGVQAPPVTDGLLLPWHVEGVQGTIFVMAHQRTQAFDMEDLRMMETLADFAAMAMLQLKQRAQLLEKSATAAAATMANDLAHQINNPLQGLTNILFLAQQQPEGSGERALATDLAPDFDRLSTLVKKLLALPVTKP
jgi:GAF domain-containing protein